MKNSRKIAAALLALLIAVGGFYLGYAARGRVYAHTRQQQCHRLLSLAADKVQAGALDDPDTMQALVSNLYAAYEYCDDPARAEQIHDLWNELIFRSGEYAGREDALTETLQGMAASIR